jgi:hypothetical protein
MAQKRTNYETVKPLIVADWRTGAYTIRELAIKHKVSHTFVNKLTKGVECDASGAVSKIVELNHDLAKLDLQTVSSVNEVALGLIKFENANNARMELATRKAMEMLEDVDKVSDVKQVMDVLKIHREARLGKSPDTAIQINNSAPQVKTINDFYSNT